eukprot:g32257.t1
MWGKDRRLAPGNDALSEGPVQDIGKKGSNPLMRRNSVTPLASPEPNKKPRIEGLDDHVASSSSAMPVCLASEVSTPLPGQ